MKILAFAFLAAALAAAVILPGTGVPFYNTPEPQEALVVQEMVRTGDWVLPRRNGEEIPSKPPLYHWVATLFSLARGEVDELVVRLPSVAAASLTVGLVAAVAAAEWGAGAAVAAAVVLATSPEWARWAGIARTDAVFAFLVTLAFLAGEAWMRSPTTARVLAIAAAAGAATLAKGPAGALLPVLGLAVQPRAWRALRGTAPAAVAAGAVVFLVVAGSWYAAALDRAGLAFFQKQILLENVFRFLPEDGGPSRHNSIFFYVPMLLVGMFPWSLLLPFAIVDRPRRRPRPADAAFANHLLAWVGVVFLVCTAASGKRSNYILPLYPAAALLVGEYGWRLLREATADPARAPRAVRWVAVLTAALLGVLGLVLVLWRAGLEPWAPVLPFLHVRDREILPLVVDALGAPGIGPIAAVVALAVALVVSLRRRRADLAVATLAATMAGATLAGAAIVRPAEAELKTFEPFARRVAARVAPEERLRFFRKMHYGVLFYLERHAPVEHVDVGALRPGWALVWEEDWNALPESDRAHAAVVEASPPAARHRADSRLLLVRFRPLGGS